MNIALLILTIAAMLAVKVLFKENPGLGMKLQAGLCVVAIALVVMRISDGDNLTTGTELTGELHEIVGWGLGQKLTDDFPSGGDVLVLIPPIVSPASERDNKAILRGLKEGADSSIKLQPYQLDHSAGTEDPSIPQAYSVAENALDALDNGKGYVAAVGLAPIPLKAWADRGGPPLYLYDAFGNRGWVPFLNDGTVKAVVHRQAAPKVSEVMSGQLSLRQGFDAVFQLVTE